MITGCLFIISAPSGAGKTSLISKLISNVDITLSISYTTRSPRPGETDGKDYHFVSEETFRQMLLRGEFVESAEVYGNLYGTSQQWINTAITSGQDILLEIDCQGASQIKHIFPEAIGIFILPPSVDTLESRLKARAQDNPEVIRKRIAAVHEEIAHIAEFDYAVINNQLDDALNDLIAIVRAEHLKRERQVIKYQALIRQLS